LDEELIAHAICRIDIRSRGHRAAVARVYRREPAGDRHEGSTVMRPEAVEFPKYALPPVWLPVEVYYED
jgi:hypothetical protein